MLGVTDLYPDAWEDLDRQSVGKIISDGGQSMNTAGAAWILETANDLLSQDEGRRERRGNRNEFGGCLPSHTWVEIHSGAETSGIFDPRDITETPEQSLACPDKRYNLSLSQGVLCTAGGSSHLRPCPNLPPFSSLPAPTSLLFPPCLSSLAPVSSLPPAEGTSSTSVSLPRLLSTHCPGPYPSAAHLGICTATTPAPCPSLPLTPNGVQNEDVIGGLPCPSRSSPAWLPTPQQGQVLTLALWTA